jgi:DNA invertase Pin-like site-specific DNA recombinase
LRQLINTVEGLEARGIGFQFLTESIDTQTPGGKLIFHVIASLAEFERGVIRERTIAGLANARGKGRIGGRPRAMTEEDVQMAKTLLADPKVNVVDIAKKLGIGLTTLYRAFPGGRSALAKQSHEP